MVRKYVPEEQRIGTAGHILYHEYILEQNLTFTEVARRMGVTKSTVGDLIDNCRDITDAMAEKLAVAFPTTNAAFWKSHKRNKLRFHKGKAEADRYW